MDVQQLAKLEYPYTTTDMASRVRTLADRETFIHGYNTRKKEEAVNDRKEIATRAMAALLGHYKLNKPDDQDIVCALSVELADTLIEHLNRIK
jgi:hypothetical protein